MADGATRHAVLGWLRYPRDRRFVGQDDNGPGVDRHRDAGDSMSHPFMLFAPGGK